jgi:hypothetical protein
MALYIKLPNLYSLYTEVLNLYSSIHQGAKSVAALTGYGFICDQIVRQLLYPQVTVCSHRSHGPLHSALLEIGHQSQPSLQCAHLWPACHSPNSAPEPSIWQNLGTLHVLPAHLSSRVTGHTEPCAPLAGCHRARALCTVTRGYSSMDFYGIYGIYHFLWNLWL